jgi:phosphoglycerate-specific signal transduction histidine kinase
VRILQAEGRVLIRGMVYSLEPVSVERGPEVRFLEKQLTELEKLAETLENAPDAEVVGVLDRAVALLAEINTSIEASLLEAEDEARKVGELLEGIDFGPFDAALEDLERPTGEPDGY